MQAFTSDHFVLPLPPGHRFPMGKYALLRDAVAQLLPQIRLCEAPPATEGELALAHEPGYIDAVLQGWLSPAQQREIGFPWSPRMAERACRSVGASIAAARVALSEGVAANLAGGTHHASAAKGTGYCVFNDVAVAARLMQAEWHRHHRSLLRVLVIDLDVHQGNGTAEIFADDPTVFTFSMHGARNFPFRKVPSDLDVDLPDGCDDTAYLAALAQGLDTVWQRLQRTPPGLVFYLAGADPHEGDRLGRLKVTAGGLAQRDRFVLDALRERGLPVALSMAGGYGHDIAVTVALQRHTLALASESWVAWQQRRAASATRQPIAGADGTIAA
ncbi:MAG TPA: histone deacetylase [Ideonella sp.]|uniref:histone deacetylase family protein n=1 Tax=Ideonella sp. TaxID=1929293 RepID=UPI002C06FE08|nr:histone deacetylase [Ideonella sp.]HSI50891.1 histone deacetylase [Ideonella sp.]